MVTVDRKTIVVIDDHRQRTEKEINLISCLPLIFENILPLYNMSLTLNPFNWQFLSHFTLLADLKVIDNNLLWIIDKTGSTQCCQ